MTDVLFAISDKPIVTSRGVRSAQVGGKHVYTADGSFENSKYIVQLYGDLYEDGEIFQRIVSAYEKAGPEGLSRLDGDFAIVLFDKASTKLVAARDKLGVKSLFYLQENGFFAVSNRAASIFELRPEARRPNPRRNLFYVGSHYRHIDAIAEDTFFADLKAVRQGHYVEYSSGKVRVAPYWTLELIDLENKSKKQLAGEYLELLRASIKRRLAKSKNPVFMVSSGMDSSGVAAVASELLGRKVPLITTVFDENTEYNEASDIVPLADKIASTWHRLTVRGEGILADIERILRDANGPYYTITQLMHYYLCRHAHDQGYDSVFGGLGGDEANCGEIEEYLFYFADLKAAGKMDELEDAMKGWAKYHSHPLYPKNREVLETFFKKQIDFGKPGTYSLDLERFNRYFAVFNDDFRREYYSTPVPEQPYPSYLRNKLYQDLFCEVIPCVLTAEENNLRTFGLAGRLPYMDAAVMQYGFSIPISMKYVHGGTKAIIREALRGQLPDQVVDNFIKKGWNAPFDEWLKQQLSAPIRDILNSPTDRQRRIYNIAAIRQLLDEHLQGRKNHMLFFWQLLNYEKWFALHFQPAHRTEQPARRS